MISVQAECTIAEAVALLKERAFANGQTVEQLAIDVVGRQARFGPSN